MKSKPILKEGRIVVLVALAWLSFLACNKDDQLLAPEKNDLKLNSDLQATSDRSADLKLVPRLVPIGDKTSSNDLATICRRDKEEIGTSSALIGPEGGVLRRANHQLVIPAGALSRTVRIDYSILASPYLECELKPYGLKFKKPAQLILSYSGTCDRNVDGSALKVAYYNPHMQLGVLIPTAFDSAQHTVTVEIERFAFSARDVSRYGLIKR